MIRERLAEALNMVAEDENPVRKSTLRLICTALKDRDTAARTGGGECLNSAEIVDLLSKMVVQRQASAKSYEQDGRLELAQQERDEIAIISEFLPGKLDDATMIEACKKVVDDVDANGLRDVGRCMSALKSQYGGQIDTIEASRVVKSLLTGGEAEAAG